MQREIQKRRKGRKVNKTVRYRILAAAAVVLLAGISFTVFAKYYKTGYNHGMAIASGFYFSSNYMTSVDEIRGKSMEEIGKNYRDSIMISGNPTSWKGTDAYNFYVEVRNYDNQLLYNDMDLNVEYTVSFMLLDEPRGASYTVSDGTDTKALGWSGGRGSVVTFQGTLSGGMLSADTYTLSVAMQDETRYAPADVLMVAYPTGPSYLTGTKSIAGVIGADYEGKEFRIEPGTGFVIARTASYEKDWQAEIKAESGYAYQLITSGNYTGGTAARRKIRLKWRDDLYKINAFGTYYLEIQEKIQKDPSQKDILLGTETDAAGKTWKVMEVEVLPYASLKFVFFRKDENFEEIIEKMKDTTEFETSVQVEVVSQE